MTYIPPSQTEIILQAQNYLSNALGYVPIYASVENVLALMTAGLVDTQYDFIYSCFLQTTPFYCTGSYIDGWAALKGIVRLAATAATGTVAFAGVAGTVVPSGTALLGLNGQMYATTAAFAVGTSTSVLIMASVAGAAGNGPQGMNLSLVNSITGLTPGPVPALSAISGGVDIESDASLRSRMLQRYANPPQGGSFQDFIGWTLAVPGVTRAYLLPNHIASGTVTVLPMFDLLEASHNGFPQGSNGVAVEETRGGFAVATGDQLAVAESIYPKRPVTCLVYVQSPVAQPVYITISGLGSANANTWNGTSWATTPTAIASGILAAIANIFQLVADVYGDGLSANILYAAIESVSGVTSFNVLAPVGSIPVSVGNLPVVGTLILQS